MNGLPLHVDSETFEVACSEAGCASENLGSCTSVEGNPTFRGDPVVWDPRLDKLRERVSSFLQSDDDTLIDKCIQKGLADFNDPPGPDVTKKVSPLPPWLQSRPGDGPHVAWVQAIYRWYSRVDKIEFWASVVLIVWWGLIHA